MDFNPRPPPKPKPPLSDHNRFTVTTSTALGRLKSSLSSPTPNPNPNSKPCNSTSAARRLNVDCSESETSIGSSNFNEVAQNPTLPLNSTPHRVPLSDIGNKDSRSAFGPEYRRKKAPEKTKNKGKHVSLPLYIYSLKEARVRGKPAAAPTEKTEDMEMVISMPDNFTSIVNTRNKKKENVEPLSCPPLPRTRRKRTVSNEAGNICVSHSYTASQPKRNKKKRRLPLEENSSMPALPQEYVKQQKAYFKEVDDFELAEEEVSENESDNDDTSMATLTK